MLNHLCNQTQSSQSIFILQSAVSDLFRESLKSRGFIEIHSPKLQAAATESGASVFKVDYFKGTSKETDPRNQNSFVNRQCVPCSKSPAGKADGYRC
jgi:aspartyl/asparaginyl-tRNA synthetase